jgi:hypothetical protein
MIFVQWIFINSIKIRKKWMDNKSIQHTVVSILQALFFHFVNASNNRRVEQSGNRTFAVLNFPPDSYLRDYFFCGLLKIICNETAENTVILYCGSRNPENAKELFDNPDVDGGLTGGASLKAEDFAAIIGRF